MNARLIQALSITAALLAVSSFVSPVSAQTAPTPATKSGREPFLSPAEQVEHEKKMQNFKTYQECSAYMAEHRKKIEARAKEQGRSMRNVKTDECDDMRKQGQLK
jgi:hypothetical protein